MEFRKLNYTTLIVGLEGEQGAKEELCSMGGEGLLDQGKGSQNRVKESKGRK